MIYLKKFEIIHCCVVFFYYKKQEFNAKYFDNKLTSLDHFPLASADLP